MYFCIGVVKSRCPPHTLWFSIAKQLFENYYLKNTSRLNKTKSQDFLTLFLSTRFLRLFFVFKKLHGLRFFSWMGFFANLTNLPRIILIKSIRLAKRCFFYIFNLLHSSSFYSQMIKTRYKTIGKAFTSILSSLPLLRTQNVLFDLKKCMSFIVALI